MSAPLEIPVTGSPLTLEQVEAWRRTATGTGRAVLDVVAAHLDAVAGAVDWGDSIEIQFCDGDRSWCS